MAISFPTIRYKCNVDISISAEDLRGLVDRNSTLSSFFVTDPNGTNYPLTNIYISSTTDVEKIKGKWRFTLPDNAVDGTWLIFVNTSLRDVSGNSIIDTTEIGSLRVDFASLPAPDTQAPVVTLKSSTLTDLNLSEVPVNTVDFTALSALPNGWTVGPKSLPSFSSGITIGSDRAESYGEAFLRSPLFVPKDGQVIEIEFVGSAPNSSDPGAAASLVSLNEVNFMNNDALAWLSNNTFWLGSSPGGTALGWSENADLRYRIVFLSGVAYVYFQVKEGSFYNTVKTQIRTLTAQALAGSRIFIDAMSKPITIKRVRY